MRDESKGKKREDDEDRRHPLAFAPGTNAKRRTESSPRRTSLHRRTEGHGVYFCRVAAAVAGQKACGFHPGPRASLFLSIPVCLSLFPFSPAAFPRISLSVPRFHPSQLTIFFSSLSPRRSLSLLFSLPATPLFMPPHSPGRPCLAPASLFIRHAQSPPVSFSPFLHSSSTASPAPERNHLRRFFADAPRLSSSSTCKPIAHASERTRRSESRRERGSEIEREKESEYRIHERAKTRRGRAGAREREEERDQRRDVPAKSDGIRRGRKEEEEGEKRWMLKRGRASGTPANGWNVR